MTPPEYWYNPAKPIGFLRTLVLVPLSWLIYLGSRLRQFFSFTQTVDCPVICVGNFTVGGAGKTPTTLYIANYLASKGAKPAIVSRGYRGRLRGPIKVDPHIHTFQEVGDEPLMMAKNHDVYIAKKRSSGAKLAIQNGATVIIMDDGLQHPHLYQDLKLSVVDAKKGFGNGYLLPAGPLREPLSYGLGRIDGLITIRSYEEAPYKLTLDHPQMTAYVTINKTDGATLKDKSLVAFAGLAHPDKFFEMLTSEAFTVKATKAFPDHYQFTKEDEQDLKDLAERNNAQLVTTEKDYVRLSTEIQKITIPVRITLEFDDTNTLKRVLDRVYSPKT